MPTSTLNPSTTAVVLKPEGCFDSLDEEKCQRIFAELTSKVDDQNAATIVLDFTKVEYFGARFCGLLAKFSGYLQARNRHAILIGLNCCCREMIEVTHLDRLFEVPSEYEL